MPLITAYISVVLIWATTPLAIKWSSESVGFLFGISSRTVLAAVLASGLVVILRKKIAWHREAIQTYIASGLGIFTAMISVYWASQFIPSGWVSMIYGITPIITGLFAMKILGERGLNFFRTTAILISIAGLYVMLKTGLEYSVETVYGIAGVLVSTLFYSFSMVMVKKIDADIDTYSTVTGGLIIAAILFALTWNGLDSEMPDHIPYRAGFSILYLATIGSLFGFFLFYYVLKRIEATQTSLITLITPVCAILLGHTMNNEPLSWNIIFGCVLILTGLLLFQFEVAISHIKITHLLRTRK